MSRIFFEEMIKATDLRELDGKKLTMFYGQENGYGVLMGKDEEGNMYALREITVKEEDK